MRVRYTRAVIYYLYENLIKLPSYEVKILKITPLADNNRAFVGIIDFVNKREKRKSSLNAYVQKGGRPTTIARRVH